MLEEMFSRNLMKSFVNLIYFGANRNLANQVGNQRKMEEFDVWESGIELINKNFKNRVSTFLLCLKNFEKNKQISSKVPKPIKMIVLKEIFEIERTENSNKMKNNISFYNLNDNFDIFFNPNQHNLDISDFVKDYQPPEFLDCKNFSCFVLFYFILFFNSFFF